MDSLKKLGSASEKAIPSLDPTKNAYLNKHLTSPRTANTLGLLNQTLLPNLNLHASLSLVAYIAGRVTRRVDAKDWLWPSGMVLNAWYNGVIHPAFKSNTSLSTSLRSLSWTQKLILAGITAWGARLFYRVAKRSIARGKDDPRYAELSDDTSFWSKAYFSVFLPEAVFQSLISLSWTIPLMAPGVIGSPAPPAQYKELLHAAAVGLYCAGMGMEVLADSQLQKHRDSGSDNMNTEGIWSIVRHPNYLGDTLTHASFPLLLYANNAFHPLILLGPLSNYFFLRFVGGDRENEDSQEKRYRLQNPKKYVQLQSYREKKNSFWPGVNEVGNRWVWVLVGLGGVGVVVERVAKIALK